MPLLYAMVRDKFGRVKTKEGKSINPDGTIVDPTVEPSSENMALLEAEKKQRENKKL